MLLSVKWRHPDRALREWLILLLVLLVFGATLAYTLNENHTRIDARERERLSHQCVVVSMNLSRQFRTINMALEGILAELPSWRSQKNEQALAVNYLKLLNNAMSGVLTFLVMDAKGTVEASDRPELVGKNFAQRDYFKAVTQSPNPSTLYVRPPFVSSRGNFTMNLIRMIPGPHGEFDGLAIAALDAEEFKILLDSVIYRPGIRAALIHGDGIPFLMAPNSRSVEGADLVRPGSFFSQHIRSGRIANVFTGVFNYIGDERMVAVQTIQDATLSMDKPMVIAVDRRLQDMYVSWNHELVNYCLFFAAVSLLMVASLTSH